MDNNAIILILFLIALVSLLLFLHKKSQAPSSTPPPTASVPDAKTELKDATAYRPEIPVKAAPEAPKHNTVYTYIATQPTVRCPYCDGENPLHSQTCCICGNSLKR